MTLVRTYGGPVVDRPSYYDGAFQLGAGIALGGFSVAGPLPSFLYTGAMAIGSICGGSPAFSGRFGEVSSYIDGLCNALGIGRPSPPPKPKEVPHDTDSYDPAKRGASYLKNYLNGKKELPSRGDVINNLKDRGYLKNQGEEDKWKRGDKALRVLTENVIGQWMDDADARTAFALKWPNARTLAEKLRLLLDPKGDHGYMKHITAFYPELQTENKSVDQIWEDIVDWFVNNGVAGAIDSMGTEAASFASRKGVSGEPPLTDEDKSKYAGNLMAAGYTDSEAVSILSAIRTKPEAEELVRSLINRQSPGYVDQSAAYEQKLGQLMEELAAAKDEGEKKRIQEEIIKFEGSRKAAEENARKRAGIFLKDLLTSTEFKLRYGFGGELPSQIPSSVKDVPTAAAWVYRRIGRNVVIPPADANADISEGHGGRKDHGKTPEADPSAAGTQTEGPTSDAKMVRISDKSRIVPLQESKKFDGDPTEYKFGLRSGGQPYYCPANPDGSADQKNWVDSTGKKVKFVTDPSIAPDPVPEEEGVRIVKINPEAMVMQLQKPKKFKGDSKEYKFELRSEGQTYYCPATPDGKPDQKNWVDSNGARVGFNTDSSVPLERMPAPGPAISSRPQTVQLKKGFKVGPLEKPIENGGKIYKFGVEDGGDVYFCGEKGGNIDFGNCITQKGGRKTILVVPKEEPPEAALTDEDKKAIQDKGYNLETDLRFIATLVKSGIAIKDLPPRKDYALWTAKQFGFKDLGDVEMSFAKWSGGSSDHYAVLYDSKAPINDVYDVVEFAVTINKIVAKVKQESDAAEESTVGNGTRIVEIGRTRYKVFYSRNEAGEIKLKDFEAVK